MFLSTGNRYYDSIHIQLASLDRELWPTEHDGNSFFTSIARQLPNSGIIYNYLRELLFTTSDDPLQKYLAFAQSISYEDMVNDLKLLREPGVWFPHMRDVVVAILQDELDTEIAIIRHTAKPHLVDTNRDEPRSSLVVIVQGINPNHYDGTRLILSGKYFPEFIKLTFDDCKDCFFRFQEKYKYYVVNMCKM